MKFLDPQKKKNVLLLSQKHLGENLGLETSVDAVGNVLIKSLHRREWKTERN